MKSLTPTQLSEILQSLDQQKISYRRNVGLSVLSSFKIGGISPLVIEPENNESLLLTLELLKRTDAPFKVLGGGSNLLLFEIP